MTVARILGVVESGKRRFKKDQLRLQTIASNQILPCGSSGL